MFLFLDVASPIPEFHLINENKIIHSIKIIQNINEKLSDNLIPTFIEINKTYNFHKNLKKLIITIGPGSYSGLRIGSSFAKGLALSLSKPIVPISTFEGMNLSIKNNGKYYISIYSHRDYAFFQLYHAGKIVEESKCDKIENMVEYDIYGYAFDDKIINDRFTDIKPSSKNIGQIALDNFSNLVENKINNVRPLYLEMEK